MGLKDDGAFDSSERVCLRKKPVKLEQSQVRDGEDQAWATGG